MLNIPIDDKYLITSDRFNFILCKKVAGKTTKNINGEYFVEISYHPNLKFLFAKYADIMLLNSECRTFREVIAKLDEIEKVITDVGSRLHLRDCIVR